MKKLLFVIFIGFVIVNTFAMKQNTDYLKVKNTCRMYTMHGKPQVVYVNGNEYDMTGENLWQGMFINEFDREQLQKLDECIRIETNQEYTPRLSLNRKTGLQWRPAYRL